MLGDRRSNAATSKSKSDIVRVPSKDVDMDGTVVFEVATSFQHSSADRKDWKSKWKPAMFGVRLYIVGQVWMCEDYDKAAGRSGCWVQQLIDFVWFISWNSELVKSIWERFEQHSTGTVNKHARGGTTSPKLPTSKKKQVSHKREHQPNTYPVSTRLPLKRVSWAHLSVPFTILQSRTHM